MIKCQRHNDTLGMDEPKLIRERFHAKFGLCGQLDLVDRNVNPYRKMIIGQNI